MFVQCALSMLGCLVLCVPAFSQELTDSDAVKVYVRTIKACDGFDSQKVSALVDTPRIDPELNDLKGKLLQLPFRSYRLLAAREAELTLKRRDILSLPNGQLLFFRPVYV